MNLQQEYKKYNDFDLQNYLQTVTENQIKNILRKQSIDELEFLALLSSNAEHFLEEMARKANEMTGRQFGKTIVLYTPMYLSNYCINQCLYCGFNAKNKIVRKQLSLDEVEKEAREIALTGLRHILVLTGDAKKIASLEYLVECFGILKKFFTSINIEIYALEADEYSQLINAGVDGLTIYQETYNRSLYDKLHLKGPKKNFDFRLTAPDRACAAGIRTVNIGALLGLDWWQREIFHVGLHANYLQNRYPDVEIGISLPRMRPHTGEFHHQYPVSDKNLVQMMTAFRLFMPRAGISISTREEARFRDRIIKLGVTKMSAGSTTAVGGHTQPDNKTSQFDISDHRTVEQIANAIKKLGYQPVFKDW